jgi:hypothetical protein
MTETRFGAASVLIPRFRVTPPAEATIWCVRERGTDGPGPDPIAPGGWVVFSL